MRLLCTYTRVEDSGHETMEMLEASGVLKRVTLLVTFTIVIATRDVVEAFSAEHQPDLVSCLSLCAFLLL